MAKKGVLTATIQNNTQNQLMSAEYQLISIDIIREINRIPTAQIIVLDGDAAKREFKISNASFFAPGQEIEIDLYYLGQSQKETTVFKGFVIKHKIKVSAQGSFLQLTLKDPLFKLTNQIKSTVYENMKDSEIIQAIFQQADLSVTAADTHYKNEQMLCYQCNDWDFILKRAEANGQWVAANQNTYTVQAPQLHGEAKYTFNYGFSEFYDFEMELDVSHQPDSIKATAWDVEAQNLLQPQIANDFTLQQGNLSVTSQLAATVGLADFFLENPSTLSLEETQAWANAEMTKKRLSMLRGRLKISGSEEVRKIQLGDTIKILGVSQNFKGTTIVTGLRHQVTEQGWQTDIQFGLPATWHIPKQNEVTHAPASGLLPAVHGLQVGVVQNFEEDKTGQYRVKVKLPILEEGKNIIWARMAAIDAGNKRGFFFRPEVGDEVILGFFNNDPRQPVILGAMFSSQHEPPLPITQENFLKGLVTKENLSLVFNEQDKSIALTTPAGKKILISDTQDKTGVFISDGENTIDLTEAGITQNSSKHVEIKAKQNVMIKGQKIDTQ